MEVPNGVMGEIHGLCLQLLANGIISLQLTEIGHLHSGKDTLTWDHVVVNQGLDKDGSPAYIKDDLWSGVHFIPRAKLLTVDGGNKCGRNSRGQGGKKSGTKQAHGRECGARGRGRLVSVYHVTYYLLLHSHLVISFPTSSIISE